MNASDSRDVGNPRCEHERQPQDPDQPAEAEAGFIGLLRIKNCPACDAPREPAGALLCAACATSYRDRFGPLGDPLPGNVIAWTRTRYPIGVSPTDTVLVARGDLRHALEVRECWLPHDKGCSYVEANDDETECDCGSVQRERKHDEALARLAGGAG